MLVATDIAARGIHVDDIDLVVHVDPPAEHKAYLHRSGRTARAGAEGVVVTVATPEQAGDVRTLTRQAGITPDGLGDRPGAPQIVALAGPAAPYVEPAPEAPKQVQRPARSRPANGQGGGRGGGQGRQGGNGGQGGGRRTTAKAPGQGGNGGRGRSRPTGAARTGGPSSVVAFSTSSGGRRELTRRSRTARGARSVAAVLEGHVADPVRQLDIELGHPAG